LDRVKDLLGVLADVGLVERHGIQGGRPGAFVLSLSPEGRAVAQGKLRPDLPLVEAPAKRRGAGPKLPPVGDPDQGVLARLKEWRTSEARRRSLPSYVIFHDSTLAALAATRPRDRDALLAVKGVGPAKVDAYGEALLKILE
jgi:ATP-dependent DNA helicase RecQ